MVINNLKIPNSILPYLKDSIQVKDISPIRDIINTTYIKELFLFSLRSIEGQTEHMIKMCNEEKEYQQKNNGKILYLPWLGSKKGGINPGDIDPEKMLVIGILDYDTPVCLDFRFSMLHPSVIYFDGKYWIKIADSYLALMKTLGISL